MRGNMPQLLGQFMAELVCRKQSWQQQPGQKTSTGNNDFKRVTSPADTSTLRVHVHESHADIGMNALFATRKVMANINVGRKMAKKNDLDNSIVCF